MREFLDLRALRLSRQGVREDGDDRIVRTHVKACVPGTLDSNWSESYLHSIPIHRLPGGAFVRASVFRLGTGLF